MAVFKVERNKGYTVMSNYHLKDKNISLKAKGLLSQMLSLPDNWNYTLRGLVTLNKEKLEAIRTAVNELEQAGYITRTQGRLDNGKMTNIVYNVYEIPCSGKPCTEKPNTVSPISEKPNSDKPVTENKTVLNIKETNTEKENTDLINHPSINQDEMDSMDVYRWIVYEKISYDALLEQETYSKDQIDEIVEIMLESICSTAKTQRIGKEDIPTEVVKSRFLKVDSSHIEYILGSMKENTKEVRNIKAYLKTVIYNAPVTIGNYYAAKVNHDLYGTD